MQIHEYSAAQLRQMFERKELGVREATQHYLDRIRALDGSIGAYLTLCEDQALAQADAVQRRYDAGEALPPLAGVPVALKDNICTNGVRTTCGSRMLENFVPYYDATVAERLSAQGAILLGKTNMDEFAMGSSTEHSYYQKTHNPWDTSRVPGGSSGGSAAAVAAHLAPVALGSDTGGSIRQPASFCGVVGLKPTYGAVSRYGLVAYASSLDQIGPLTRTVTDAALLFTAIAGHDERDSTSMPNRPADVQGALGRGVRGLRIGLPREYYGEGLGSGTRASIDSAIKQYQALGAQVVEVSLPLTDYCLPTYYVLACAEASSNLSRFDGVKYGFRAADYASLDELYRNTRTEGFGTEVQRRILLGTFVLCSGYYDAYYKKAMQARTLLRRNFDEAFNQCDVLLTPTAPTTAFRFGEKAGSPLEMYLADIYTVSVNIAGLPALVLPCGLGENDMPVGMQLIAPAFREDLLFQAGGAYEQAHPFAHAPQEV